MQEKAAPSDKFIEDLKQKAKFLQLHTDQQWIDLLHYRPSALGLVRSQLKGPEFFLAERGRKNPADELEATLTAFFVNQNLSQDHTLCRFPARKKWLQGKLEIPESMFPTPSCELYQYYRERMKAHSVSVIFSSYYSDSPSSAFGHTLFKINKKAPGESGQNDLLDWGIGYAGVVTTNNSLLYIYNGLTGGFRGEFSSVPYYMKVREYNDFESRDLWNFELNLTKEEIDFFLDHLWEVGDSHFDYYFLTQNCGFHMLTVLDASVPRFRLAEKVPFWVIPADALKAITQTPDLVKSVTWRPSVYAQLKTRYGLLNQGEVEIYRDLRRDGDFNKLDGIKDKSSEAKVLDTYLLAFDFDNAKKIASEDPSIIEKRNRILSKRSKLPTIDDIQIKPALNSEPHKSHPSARFMIFQQGDNKNFEGDVTKLNMRFALHDALDPVGGYPPYSTIEMFTFEAARNQKLESTYLSRFQFLNIESLYPIDEISFKKSWGASVGWQKIFEPNCVNCNVGEARAGYGLSKELVTNQTLVYSMFYGRAQSGPELKKGFNLIIEPQIGFISYFGSINFRYFFSPRMSVVNDSLFWQTHNLNVRYNIGQSYTIDLQVSHQDEVTRLSSGFGFFF